MWIKCCGVYMRSHSKGVALFFFILFFLLVSWTIYISDRRAWSKLAAWPGKQLSYHLFHHFLFLPVARYRYYRYFTASPLINPISLFIFFLSYNFFYYSSSSSAIFFFSSPLLTHPLSLLFICTYIHTPFFTLSQYFAL